MLQKRLQEFEALKFEVCREKLEKNIQNSTQEKYDQETKACMENYLDVLAKYQQFETSIR